ncbi:two-component regulator propeller domain-containing protein [Arenibacter sp. F20364]|uniref:two-component regulator propeller domain-containing protein n=1 Tax=Arenibacter sp. F20364 TaxID=2926415 RepID=UPI001FF6BDF5|nr:two-component regulator propeller domain-containing protein [Arenibacter sp. F20364]MCK0191727.1 ATP-binding protein [Arenibacter sp. F20364]
MKYIPFYFFALLIHLSCLAQGNNTNLQKLNIDGVPFNKKTNIVFEDHLGFLWLGTDSGLYRYDGHSLVENQYDVFDEHSIPNNSINSIVEDDLGNLWIGSESYLTHYNRKSNKFKGYYKNNTTIVLGKSSDGTIWANLRNTGIVKITPSEVVEKIKFETEFNYKQKEKIWADKKQINSFSEDIFGRTWFATPNGILLLGFENRLVETGFTKNTQVLIKTKNNNFIAATNEGIFVLGYEKDNSRLEILETYTHLTDNGPNEQKLNSLSLDKETSVLWIGTQAGLIKGIRMNNRYSFEKMNNTNHNRKLYDDRINALINDRYNNLWIATNKGVDKYIGRTSIFNYTSIDENLNNFFPKSLYKESGQDILLSINNKGLYRYNQKLNSNQLLLPIGNYPIIARKDFEEKELLVGVGGHLLKSNNYNRKNKALEMDTLKSFSKDIVDIIPLNKNEIWVGLWGGGIDILNSEASISEFKLKTISNLLGKNVSVMHLDKKQNLWIGTRGDGLFKIDLINDDIEIFNPSIKDGLSSNAILCLLETGKGDLWIGTRGGGLNFYSSKTQTIQSFSKKTGLLSTTVSSIEADNSGHLWLSTQGGISRFDVAKKKFVNFGMEDGLTESHFIFNSYAKDKDGTMYFGCPGGFYSVATENYEKTDLIPNTIITKFHILSNESAESPMDFSFTLESLGPSEKLELPYNSNNIAIEFSSLDLTAPNKNEYAYKLAGINDFWHQTKASNRNANYNDLPPGNYTFKVKSSNSDGVWNTTPTQLSFVIAPPYWRSNLAYFIYAVLLAICIYITYLLVQRWYTLKKNLVTETISREKDNEINRMKMVFFTDISHELRTPLSLILGTIEKVVKEKQFTLSPLTSQRIYNNTLRMHRLINQIMDIRKFDEGKLKLRISKNDIVRDIHTIKNAFNDFARIYEIKYDFICNKEEIRGWYDVDIMEKILFNLLSNAFKHTLKKGEISVTLEVANMNDNDFIRLHRKKGEYIKCSVRDNGIGIPKKDLPHIFDRYYQATKTYSNQIPGTGIGMELVQKLVERHHGKIIVESEEGVFTEFSFFLPIHKNAFDKKERIDTGKPLTRNFIHNSEFQIIDEVSSEFEAKSESEGKDKPKVLLVEDNDDLRFMVKEELKDDFNIIEASNGQEGYETILKEKPQLIICDILMPIEDGVSMLKRVKDNDEINSIPIFMLTAKNSEETKIKCLSLGAEDYIEKPFSLEFVKWKVKNALMTRQELKEKYSKIITTEPQEIEVDSQDEKFIKKLVQIIEGSMDDNLLSVEYLASEVGMSRANLYRKVQTIMDDTPVNFIKQIRLKRAAQLLRKNQMYISEVAYMTGFSNQKYFSKCFSKEYGKSPTEYAKQFSKDVATNKKDLVP